MYRVSSHRRRGFAEGEATASATNWVNTDVPVLRWFHSLRLTRFTSMFLPLLHHVRVATPKKTAVRASTSGVEEKEAYGEPSEQV